jgi:hypothetical protein
MTKFGIDSKLVFDDTGKSIFTRLSEHDDNLLQLAKKTELFVDVKNSGAKGDGVTDDTLVIKAAIALAETLRKPLYFSSGEYIISDTLLVNDTSFIGDGQGATKLVFINMNGKNGIEFRPNETDMSISVSHMGIYCKGSNGGSAIYTEDHSQQYSTYKTKYQFENLLISGYTIPATPVFFETVESWTVCLDIGDCFGAGVREVYGVGNFRIDQDPTGQLQSVFIKIQGNATVLGLHADSIVGMYFYRALEHGDKSFFQVQKFDFVHCYDGVYQTATDVTAYDESKLLNGNINAQRYGVYFHDVGSRQISGVIVRRHRKGWKGALNDWFGFHLTNVTMSWVTDCHAQPDESEGVYSGKQVGISYVTSSLISTIGFVAGSTLDEGIRFDNCTGMVTSNTVSTQNDVTEHLFNLINNTRNSQFGVYSLVSSFAGSVYLKDGTILTSNKTVTTSTI